AAAVARHALVGAAEVGGVGGAGLAVVGAGVGEALAVVGARGGLAQVAGVLVAGVGLALGIARALAAGVGGLHPADEPVLAGGAVAAAPAVTHHAGTLDADGAVHELGVALGVGGAGGAGVRHREAADLALAAVGVLVVAVTHQALACQADGLRPVDAVGGAGAVRRA